MLREKKYHLFFIAMLMCCCSLQAQQSLIETPEDTINANSSELIMVGDIVLTGNKKTKEAIILREIPFKTGEQLTLEALVKKFETARSQLMNTALFNAVIVAAENIEGTRINVVVDLNERWFLFIVPDFKPVERNMNKWLVEQKADLGRVNYGLKFRYNNATGRNDKIRVSLVSGYTKQYSFSYERQYIDKKRMWGMK